jgi:hypothetical protein
MNLPEVPAGHYEAIHFHFRRNRLSWALGLCLSAVFCGIAHQQQGPPGMLERVIASLFFRIVKIDIMACSPKRNRV